MVAYATGIAYATILILQLTALVAVLGVLGVLTWIGYTMFTEPPPHKVVHPTELDDLQPETINPNLEDFTVSQHPRYSVIVGAEIGEGTIVRDHVNLHKCKVGKNCKIESFVYIEEGVTIGDNCKIKPHVFIPTGVTIEDDVFIGPNVTFTNDKYPRVKGQWQLLGTVVERGASIGANSVIMYDVTIGDNVVIPALSLIRPHTRIEKNVT
jgi:acetyltransferase-like isoleucine patch superfamily enzyme